VLLNPAAEAGAASSFRIYIPRHARRPRWAYLVLALVAAELMTGTIAAGWAVTPESVGHSVGRLSTATVLARTSMSGGALLEVSDLGNGWIATPVVAGRESATCFRPRADLYSTNPSQTASSSWVNASGGLPTASEIVASYPSVLGAERAFDEVQSALSGCSRFVAISGKQTAQATVGVAPLPAVGDRSAAFQVIVTLGSAVGGADFVVAQRSSRVMLLVYGDSGQPDPDRVGVIESAAAARLTGRL
jgi:hypothetical protein